jgi:dihydroorotate dehydrogenase electron transfer subunit
MTKEVFEAQIVNNAEIAGGVYRLTLHCGDAFVKDAEPGRFIDLYLNNGSMLLPRPISVCSAEKDRIALVYRVAGKGTKELSGYQSGDTIRISPPLGQGYYIDRVVKTLEDSDAGTKTVALVAGGLGVPPMVELAKAVRNRLPSVKLVAALGYQDEAFLTEELGNFCDEVLVATESGREGFRGNVLEMMEALGFTADYYLSCGPKPMLKALAGICGRMNKPLQVSLEERMGCGYGACVGCTCKIKETGDIVRQKKVCRDGPVFFGNEVVWSE